MLRKLVPFFIFFVAILVSIRTLKAVNSTNEQEQDSKIYADLPAEKEGKYPVHIPDYDGVDQLLVLSSKWVVVVTDNQKEVVDELDKMTNGEYKKNVNIWEESLKNNNPNWTVRRNYLDKMIEQKFGEAREAAGEKNLDNPNFYKITSETDPNYKEAKQPLRVTRFIPALGEGNVSKRRVPGSIDIYYAHYNYIELPDQMKTGDKYTIELQNGKKVTFLFDELRTISRAIKVNQVGYLPNAPKKYAYLGGYLQEFGPLDFSEAKNFFVVSAKTGDVVFQGDVKLRAANPRFDVTDQEKDPNKRPLVSGEDIYEMDITGLNQEGEFFISIPGVGRSWTFRHAPDAYGDAFYTVARALYHQRSGMEINKNNSAWSRKAYHTGPAYESLYLPFFAPMDQPQNYERFDVIGFTFDKNTKTDDAKGGWYDASDWDKNLGHYVPLFDLMYAYELKMDNFYDGQLNLPESADGIPDILNEAEYGLLVWKKSQRPDGGVAGALETWTHPPRDDPKALYAYSQRTRWASLLYAAAAAQFAYLVKPYDEGKANEYAESAQRAYQFGIDPKNSLGETTIPAAKNRGTGEKYSVKYTENEKEYRPYRIHAATRMYMLTGDEKYLENVPDMLSGAIKPYDWPWSIKDYSPWMYYSLVFGKPSEKLPETLRNKWRKYFTDYANKLVEMIPKQPYRFSWPAHQDFWMAWGATTTTNHARALLIAYHVTNDSKYYNGALQNIDYMLGANPLGLSWTTGLGFTYPIDIQHENSELDGIMDPIPGITIYGITGGGYPSYYKSQLWEPNSRLMMKKANWNVPVWRAWASHPHTNVPQNEFTIQETISSSIFSYGMLLPNGWMPSEELKNRKPRKDKYLFGFWYLP